MLIKPKDWSVDYFLANEAHCIKILEECNILEEIPSLNGAPLDFFKDGQLVRFQGMLQDVYNPEYFFKNYEVTNTNTGETSIKSGMYRDGATCQANERVLIDSNKNENSERETWIVISTPGLNTWAKERYTSVFNDPVNSAKPSDSSTKRNLDETEPMDCCEPIKKKEKVSSNDNDAGSSKIEEKPQKSMIVSKEHILNFPIPTENGKACIVKIYNEFPHKINQIFNIIGFLSLNPNLSEAGDIEDIPENQLEKQTHHPPASVVPRLHAIKVTKEVNTYISEDTNFLSKVQSVRGNLRMILSQLLFGDEFAADYLICHLISTVYLRRDDICLGAFSLNFTHFPKNYINFIQEVYEFLKQILVKCHFFSVTVEELNDTNFVPKKDYECDRLTSGVLQLSNNTHLIIDESKLAGGQLTTQGKQNYSALSHLIQFQKLAYDFQYYNVEYETDMPALIFSEYKSFIPCQNQVVIRPCSDTVKIYPQVLEAAKIYLKDENRLNDIRQYIYTLKNTKFEFTEETTNIIQEDFVRIRQSDRSFSVDNMHSLMVLSRLMSLSHGYNSLNTEMWKRSLEMEMERMSRLPKRK